VSLAGLLDVVAGDPALAKALAAPTLSTLDLSGPAGLQPFLLAGLVRQGRTVLAVTATGREAEDLVAALGCLLDPHRVALYPSWETLPHERLSPPEVMRGFLSAIPMGRIGAAEDCVGAYLYLASGVMSGYVTGQVLEVNGGQLMP